MSRSKEGLLRRQTQQLAILARETLDEGNPIEALELVSRIDSFCDSALTTLMMIALVMNGNPEICERALQLFCEQTSKTPNAACLTPIALWLDHPRSTFLSSRFRKALEARRLHFEPNWDGVWSNPELANAAILQLKDKNPDQVHDASVCLTLAAQSSSWQKWMRRYEKLGGSIDDPKYLKVYVSKFFPSQARLTRHVVQKLRRYVELVDERTARAFLRRLTPTKPSRKGWKFNPELARAAMHIFVSQPTLQLEHEDWVHVAAAAFYVGDDNIQRIVLRTISEMERTPALQQLFERLVAMHGLPNPRLSAFEELRSRTYNPIWERIGDLTPVDANARMILARYSESWLG